MKESWLKKTRAGLATLSVLKTLACLSMSFLNNWLMWSTELIVPETQQKENSDHLKTWVIAVATNRPKIGGQHGLTRSKTSKELHENTTTKRAVSFHLSLCFFLVQSTTGIVSNKKRHVVPPHNGRICFQNDKVC